MAIQIPRGPNESCEHCGPKCRSCGAIMALSANAEVAKCPSCGLTLYLELETEQLGVFEEDPDRRPYIWDLEE